MEFDQHKPIYLQIADAICERILTGTWPEGDRIPSVRECGVSLEVNPNPVARPYDEPSTEALIPHNPSIGASRTPGAKRVIREKQRSSFISGDLKEVFRKMEILGISIEEIVSLYRKQQTTADNSRQQQ